MAVYHGHYLYSRAIIELVRLDDLAPLRVFARVHHEMTIGEMRQLEAHDKLAYDGGAVRTSDDRSKTASLLSVCVASWARSGARRRIGGAGALRPAAR